MKENKKHRVRVSLDSKQSSAIEVRCKSEMDGLGQKEQRTRRGAKSTYNSGTDQTNFF